MHHSDSRPQGEAADATMAAIYQQLDDHVSDSDAPYNINAGLERLARHMHRETRRDADLVSITQASGQALGEPPVANDSASVIYAYAEAAVRMSREARNRSYLTFGGIFSLAVISLCLLAFGHWSASGMVTVAVVNGVVAIAGTLIHYSATAIARGFARTSGSVPARSEPRTVYGSQRRRKPDTDQMRLKTPIFSLEFRRTGSSSPRHHGLRHRIGTGLLAGLTVIALAALGVGLAWLLARHPAPWYAIGLAGIGGGLVPLLGTSFLWHLMDRGAPGAGAEHASAVDTDLKDDLP